MDLGDQNAARKHMVSSEVIFEISLEESWKK